jgi:hypothetical protein
MNLQKNKRKEIKIMPNTQIYTNELELFKRTYNLKKYDLKEIEIIDDKFRLVNDPLTKPSISGSPAAKFTNWVSKTLSIYFETNTMLNADGKYMSSFDVQEFLTDFERLAVAKYHSELQEGQVPNRKEYAGANMKALDAVFSEYIQKMNKPLPTVWMEKLKKGSMDMQKLQDITTKAYDNMDKKWYVDENEMAGNLTNVVAAYEAMKQLRASRKGVWGWIWKVILNRGQNRQEKEYLQQLDTQIKQLIDKGYKVEAVAEKLTGKTVLGRDVNAKEEATKIQVKKVSLPQASPVESNVKSATMKPVADQIEDKFAEISSEMLVELYRKTSGDLPSDNETEQEREDREQRERNRSYAYKFLLQGMKGAITELNQQFDEAVANGGDPKAEMKNVVREVFKATVGRFSMNIEDGKLEKAEAFKNAAQIIINNFTAVAIYPNEISDVVNTYIEQNVVIYNEIVGAGKDYSKEIDLYQDDYAPAFGEDHPFIDNDVNKSEQVFQQEHINAPTVGLSKK